MSTQDQDAADATRYRWLRDRVGTVDYDGGWWGVYTLPTIPKFNMTPYARKRGTAHDHATLDAAIDAAIDAATRGKR